MCVWYLMNVSSVMRKTAWREGVPSCFYTQVSLYDVRWTQPFCTKLVSKLLWFLLRIWGKGKAMLLAELPSTSQISCKIKCYIFQYDYFLAEEISCLRPGVEMPQVELREPKEFRFVPSRSNRLLALLQGNGSSSHLHEPTAGEEGEKWLQKWAPTGAFPVLGEYRAWL